MIRLLLLLLLLLLMLIVLLLPLLQNAVQGRDQLPEPSF